MLIRQLQLFSAAVSADSLLPLQQIKPNLVVLFADHALLQQGSLVTTLRQAFPQGVVVGCSTAGEITAGGVADGSAVVTALAFDHVRYRVAVASMADIEASWSAGESIGQQLAGDDLRAICLFGPGVAINGSSVIAGVVAMVGPQVPIAGGLAGDGGRFTGTLTVTPDGVDPRAVVAIGLYGEGLHFTQGSFGGWMPFGPTRKVTRCQGNILYSLDDEPALEIYRRYLGDHAKQLPAAGLLFPFEMLDADGAQVGLIRTILGIDEASGSLIMAGDIDPNGYLRLMHANIETLIDGAEEAARLTYVGNNWQDGVPGLAILVSCVGRKLVMGDQVDEEVESVLEGLPDGTIVTGFYSYGEIAPFGVLQQCRLHNQTMTILMIQEV
ncbi:MAG: FIST C-terminal domain-containing protein [Magnetococcales bacterium]|nr:FIST C-terminal domain-containing protein [Magnetococcales bacterium]